MKAGFIYLIEGGVGGPFKIGFTANSPRARLRTLQTGNPYALKLWAIIDGPIEFEAALHRLLAKYRLCGEWFEPSDDVLSVAMTLACPEATDAQKRELFTAEAAAL